MSDEEDRDLPFPDFSMSELCAYSLPLTCPTCSYRKLC